jgi:hypothetical protein
MRIVKRILLCLLIITLTGTLRLDRNQFSGDYLSFTTNTRLHTIGMYWKEDSGRPFRSLGKLASYLNKKIISIYDHKGVLTITWETEPSEEEKGYLQKAWGSAVTTYEGNQIEHEI